MIFSRVFSETYPELLIAREIVAIEKPVSLAISYIFIEKSPLLGMDDPEEKAWVSSGDRQGIENKCRKMK